jgi:pyruvate,water dikinase
MAEYLVTLGIDSISLNPDSVIATTQHVLKIEQAIRNKTVNNPSVDINQHL